MEALHDVVKAGKARYIGASSMFAWQFAKAQFVAQREGWTRFVSMQPEINLLYREEEREMLPLCRDGGVGVLPWSPLARGRLARPWGEQTARMISDNFGASLFAQTQEADRRVAEALAEVAARRAAPRAQVALAWLLQKQGVTAPIIGASQSGHLHDAVASLDLTLTDEEISILESHYVPHAVVGFE
jgi:aryl-alcohol dehydrogenase-like predicted oxidoreductase